jgi:hypothetical protein
MHEIEKLVNGVRSETPLHFTMVGGRNAGPVPLIGRNGTDAVPANFGSGRCCPNRVLHNRAYLTTVF